MAKVITLSMKFPVGHPKQGQPTYFVEKFLTSIGKAPDERIELLLPEIIKNYYTTTFKPKHHTIRKGRRWKTGDMASIRVWSGKPYNSKQIVIKEVELTVYDFEISPAYKMLPGDYEADIIINHNYYNTSNFSVSELAVNDGLTLPDLLNWFKYPEPFVGQILCWNDKVKY